MNESVCSYRVEASVRGGAGVGLAAGQHHAAPRHGQLQVGERRPGAETPRQAHQVVHRLAGVLDTPQAPGRLHTQVLHLEVLQVFFYSNQLLYLHNILMICYLR